MICSIVLIRDSDSSNCYSFSRLLRVLRNNHLAPFGLPIYSSSVTNAIGIFLRGQGACTWSSFLCMGFL